MNRKVNLDFRLYCGGEKNAAARGSFPAEVPGAVQLDYGRHFNLPDYSYSDNYKQYLDLEDKYWFYEAELPAFDAAKARAYFECGGIEYQYEIYIDGKLVYEHEGMFKPVRIALPAGAKALKIIVFPAPKREGAEFGRRQADRSFIPAVSYGWDWCPHTVPLGIWQEAYVIIKDKANIAAAGFTYTLTENFDCAAVECRVETDGGVKAVSAELFGADNICVAKAESKKGKKGAFDLSFKVKNPKLWWCNGQGEQYLYTIVFKCGDGGKTTDAVSKKLGFRRVKLITTEFNWRLPPFPFTQALPPMTIELNGRSVFGKGSNWVNPEIFFGKITRESYAPLIKLAAEAHMNLFRVWGGAIVNKESFFELCDEAGIMVWQEFPLACNCYADDAHYLSVAGDEAVSIVKRLREHPSLAMWCGGNELFTGGSSMTEQFHILRLLNSICYQYDKNTPYIHTSPIFGMRHGHYMFRYPGGEECLHGFIRSEATAYTEFGSPSVSGYEYLKTFIPPGDLVIPENQASWIAHHGIEAWEKTSWLHIETLEFYFGKCGDLKTVTERGQILQCAGYKGMFEESRRQKPCSGMALNWCYNEPWPTAANNSLVNYPALPRPSYYAVRESLKPVVASARVKKFTWRPGEEFTAGLFILNDARERLPAGVLRAEAIIGGKAHLLFEGGFDGAEENTNRSVTEAKLKLPAAQDGLFKLRLSIKGRRDADNEYDFLLAERDMTGEPDYLKYIMSKQQ